MNNLYCCIANYEITDIMCQYACDVAIDTHTYGFIFTITFLIDLDNYNIALLCMCYQPYS